MKRKRQQPRAILFLLMVLFMPLVQGHVDQNEECEEDERGERLHRVPSQCPAVAAASKRLLSFPMERKCKSAPICIKHMIYCHDVVCITSTHNKHIIADHMNYYTALFYSKVGALRETQRAYFPLSSCFTTFY
jgi:hypothetical protein